MKYFIRVESAGKSELIQKILFEYGYKWINGSKVSLSMVSCYGKEACINLEDKQLMYGSYNDYLDFGHTELSMDELIEFLIKDRNLRVDSLRYEVIKSDKGYKVGCQEITKEDSILIANYFMENK